MEITRRDIDDKTCVIALSGTLNAGSADLVKDRFRKIADEGISQVVLDMENVPFVDSSGLAALVSGLKTMNQQDGVLKLASLQSQADLLFKLTMFDKVFDIYDDADSAVTSFAL